MDREESQPESVHSEAELNRLLRRVDWRFLLPDPQPERSVILTNGTLAKGVAMVSSKTGDGQEHGVAELAVVVDPDAQTLKAAWEALRPGGSCYSEWHSSFLGGCQGLRKRFEKAGFTEVTCYWSWPSPEGGSTQFWLPLESPAVLDYFLHNRPPSQDRFEHLRRRMLQPAWRLLKGARLLAPVSVLARRPGNSPGPDAGEDVRLLEILRSDGKSLGVGRRPYRIHWLMLTGGLRSINKVVKFAFVEGERVPRLVVKHARTPQAIPALRKEAENLRALQSLPGAGTVRTPRLLFSEEAHGSISLGESVLEGQPVYTWLNRENYRSFALKATGWLVELARISAREQGHEWKTRIGEPALLEFQRNFGRAITPGFISGLKVQLDSFGELPGVFEQRDFSPWNVLSNSGGELAVLDWESAEPDGLPGMDLIYFLTYLAFFLEGAMQSGNFLEVYRKAADKGTFIGAIQAECLQIYASQLGLDPADLNRLRSMVWLIHSRSEYDRLEADLGGQPDEKKLTQCLSFQLLEVDIYK